MELGCLLIGLLCSVLSVSLPTLCHAASDHDAELDRWVLSGAVEVGVFGHTAKGNADSTLISGPRIDPPRTDLGDGPLTVIDPLAGREDVLAALVGATFEVMTPKLFSAPGRPRLFLDVNVSSALTSEVGLARDAQVGELMFPDPLVAGQILGEQLVVGRGTELSVQPQGPQIHAGFGPAFTVDFGTDRVRIKPSIVYSRTMLDVSAITKRVVRLTNDIADARTLFPQLPPIPPGGNLTVDYRFIQVADDQTEVYHAIGPALELEYETGNRIGPFALTLYIKGHASRIFGDLKTRFEQPNPVFPAEIVRYQVTQDRWNYRASTGLRFRWVPKRKR